MVLLADDAMTGQSQQWNLYVQSAHAALGYLAALVGGFGKGEDHVQAYVRAHRLSCIRALMGASTSYAKVIRSTRWAEAGVADSFLITPEFHGGGAMRAVPTALGEALSALVTGELTPGWTTSNGIRFQWEALR